MVYKKYISNEHTDMSVCISLNENNIKNNIFDLSDRIFDSKISFFNSNKSRIEQVANYIKTIFRKNNVNSIRVDITSKNEYISVNINSNQIIQFNRILKNDFGKLEFMYNINGVNFKCNNSDLNETNHKETEFNEFLNSSFIILENLKNSRPIELTNEEKTLIAIYKEFFGYYPDFSKKEDYEQVQPIMWLINSRKLGLNILNYGDYTIRYNGKPKSYLLKNILDNIVPYGQTNESLSIKIDETTTDIIKDIGEIIKKYVSGYKDKQVILDNISLVSYIIDRLVPHYYEIDDVVSVSNGKINYEQAEEIIDFLTDLDLALKSENPYEIYNENDKIKVKKNKR